VEPPDRTGGLGVVTALEQAVLAVGHVLRETAFGRTLQRYHPSTRGGGPDEPPEDPLVFFEVNHSPAITRTLMVLEMHQQAHAQLDVSSAREYLEWVARAARAIQRLAQFLWQPIPVALRNAVVDEDDLGPSTSRYLPASRFDKPGPALMEGLTDSPARKAWYVVSQAARATECYAATRAAADRLSQPELRTLLDRRRGDVLRDLDAVARGGPITIGDAQQRRLEIVRNAYRAGPAELRGPAHAIRAYNKLVNHVLWAVLGIAERSGDLPVLTESLGAVRSQGRGRERRVTVTIRALDLWIGHPPSPYVIDACIPVDGLYLSSETMVQWATEELVDLTGRRLGDLESGPAD